MSSPVTIRHATPDDADLLAWAMVEAQRGGDDEGEWDVVLPGSEPERREILAQIARTGPPHPCHHSRFLVAERGREACGAVSGHVPGLHTWSHFREAWHAVFAARGRSRESADACYARFEPFVVVRVAIPRDAWRVEWVATRPEHRGRGVIARLLDALLVWGREEGCETAFVATALENAAALRAYERAGFRRYAEWRHADYEALTDSAGDVYLRRSLRAPTGEADASSRQPAKPSEAAWD